MIKTKKPKGGTQPGAGRKPLPPEQKLNQRSIYVTDAEFEKVKEFISNLRTHPSTEK